MADAKLRTPMAKAAASCLPVPVEKTCFFFVNLDGSRKEITDTVSFWNWVFDGDR